MACVWLVLGTYWSCVDWVSFFGMGSDRHLERSLYVGCSGVVLVVLEGVAVVAEVVVVMDVVVVVLFIVVAIVKYWQCLLYKNVSKR